MKITVDASYLVDMSDEDRREAEQDLQALGANIVGDAEEIARQQDAQRELRMLVFRGFLERASGGGYGGVTTTPYALKFRVDYLPETQTDVMQKYARRTYREKLKALVRSQIDALPVSPLDRVALRCTRLSSVQPDHDNLVASFKTVIDALQPDKRFAGVVVNDRPSNLCGFEGYQQEYRWVRHPPFGGHIVVELMEVGAL